MGPAQRESDKRDADPAEMRTLRGNGWLVGVAMAFSESFPADEFEVYADFVGVPGEVVKAQARTRITVFARPSDSGVVRFVLKTYLNPHLSGVPTLGRRSVAEREYRNLLYCASLGVPAVEPVAFGERRVFPGVVRSCFVISRFSEHATDLRHWLKSRKDRLMAGDPEVAGVLHSLGALMRRVHEQRFFLRTPNLRNILLQDEADTGGSGRRLKFLDLPFARTVVDGAAARAAQVRDLGTIFGPFLRQADRATMTPFFASYLPDPVAGADEALRRRVFHAARVHNNKTVLSSLRRRIHRRWMRFARRVLREER